MSATVSLVLARARNGVIGRDGDLPWRLARDLKRFREITLGKPVVMGRRTLESIGRPLAGRTNIVLSRDPDFRPEGCETAASLTDALERARQVAAETGVDEICVIGGADVYRAALAHASRVHLTEVEINATGDVAIEPFDPAVWREVARARFAPQGEDSAAFSFVTLERRDKPGH